MFGKRTITFTINSDDHIALDWGKPCVRKFLPPLTPGKNVPITFQNQFGLFVSWLAAMDDAMVMRWGDSLRVGTTTDGGVCIGTGPSIVQINTIRERRLASRLLIEVFRCGWLGRRSSSDSPTGFYEYRPEEYPDETPPLVYFQINGGVRQMMKTLRDGSNAQLYHHIYPLQLHDAKLLAFYRRLVAHCHEDDMEPALVETVFSEIFQAAYRAKQE